MPLAEIGPGHTRASRALSLRDASGDDVPYLAALAADPHVEPFLSFGAADADRLRALIAAPGPAPGSGGLLVIESPGSDKALGGLGLTVVNARSRICDLSRVMVRPDSRRSGIALEAIGLACRHALRDHGMHRVQAECYGDNAAVHRLFERAGFTREGAPASLLAPWRLAGRGTLRTACGGAPAGGAVGRLNAPYV